MAEKEDVDYKSLYEKTKKDLKTLKSYTKVSINAESNQSVQIKLLTQLLDDIYGHLGTTASSPKPNFKEISNESYPDIRCKIIESIGSMHGDSASPSVQASPMSSALLETINSKSVMDAPATPGADSAVPNTAAAPLLYTETDMSAALRSLRDDIIKTCEKEAGAKIQQLQTERGQLQYAHDLLALELADLKTANGMLCSECGEAVERGEDCGNSDESDQNQKSGHNSGPASGISRSRPPPIPAPKSAWVEYVDPNMPALPQPGDDEPQPLPFGGLHSPVIERLLNEWTNDHNKILYLISWVEGLSKLPVLPEAFPKGLQIVEVNTMVRDGFLMLLLPLMRHMSLHRLVLFTRTSGSVPDGCEGDGTLYDIRIKVLNEANEFHRPGVSPTASRQGSVDGNGTAEGLNRRPSADLLAGPKAGLNSVFQNTVSGVFTLVNITQQSLGALATMSGVLPQIGAAVAASGESAPAALPAATAPANATPCTVDDTPVLSPPAPGLGLGPGPGPGSAAPREVAPTAAPAAASAPPASVVSQWASFLGTKVIGGMSGIPLPAPAPAGVATPTPAVAESAQATSPTSSVSVQSTVLSPAHVAAPAPVESKTGSGMEQEPVAACADSTGTTGPVLEPVSPEPVATRSDTSRTLVDTGTSAIPAIAPVAPQSAKDKMNAKLAALRQKSSKK